MPEPDTIQWFDVTTIEKPNSPIEICLNCAVQVTDPQLVVELKEVARSDMDETMTLCCNVCEGVIFQGEEDGDG